MIQNFYNFFCISTKINFFSLLVYTVKVLEVYFSRNEQIGIFFNTINSPPKGSSVILFCVGYTYGTALTGDFKKNCNFPLAARLTSGLTVQLPRDPQQEDNRSHTEENDKSKKQRREENRRMRKVSTALPIVILVIG